LASIKEINRLRGGALVVGAQAPAPCRHSPNGMAERRGSF